LHGARLAATLKGGLRNCPEKGMYKGKTAPSKGVLTPAEHHNPSSEIGKGRGVRTGRCLTCIKQRHGYGC
jgi:hypothetical protein